LTALKFYRVDAEAIGPRHIDPSVLLKLGVYGYR